MRLACLVALTLAGVFALVEAGLLLRDARLGVNETLTTVNKDLQTLDAAAEQLRAAGVQANVAAASANGAMTEERAYFAKTSLEVYKTAAAARLVLVRTDHSLNDEFMPKLGATMQDTDALMRQTASDMHATVLSMQPTLENLAEASAAAADAMADPHVRETLANVDVGTKAAAIAAGNVASTTQHVDAMSALLEKRLRQMLKPLPLAERLLERLAGLGISAYGVAK